MDRSQIFGSRTRVSWPIARMAPTRLALIMRTTVRPHVVSEIANSTMPLVTQGATRVIRDRMASTIAVSQRRSV
jgi:hypothetical protein